MNKTAATPWALAILLPALFLLLPGRVAAQENFGQIVVFGDSLSDPGNAFALQGEQNTPPYDNPDRMDPFLIPRSPYAEGGHHFSNGATWVEQFAAGLGLAGNARAAFKNSTPGQPTLPSAAPGRTMTVSMSTSLTRSRPFWTGAALRRPTPSMWWSSAEMTSGTP